MATDKVKVNGDSYRDTYPIAKWVDQLSLTGGAAGSYTVPAGVHHIAVKYTAGVLYQRSDGGTAVVPAAGITDGTGSEMVLQGEPFAVEPAQVISFINATSCFVTIACRRFA